MNDYDKTNNTNENGKINTYIYIVKNDGVYEWP